VGPIVIPDGLEDEKVLFLSDILPTGWMAAENAEIEEGDTVAVWGCGPVGLFAIQSALVMGAGKVIAIDHYPEPARPGAVSSARGHRLQADPRARGADGDVGRPRARRGDRRGRHGGHGFAPTRSSTTVKQRSASAPTARHALREAIMAVRKGGRVSIPGVYGGFLDKFPLGALMEKGLQIRTGQTHVQRYLPDLLRRIGEGEIDTTFLISHRLPLEEAPEGYRNFRYNQNDWTKVVLKP
jgi:threonine dehydrogenase-like Zn-dependent dehydrogenase